MIVGEALRMDMRSCLRLMGRYCVGDALYSINFQIFMANTVLSSVLYGSSVLCGHTG